MSEFNLFSILLVYLFLGWIVALSTANDDSFSMGVKFLITLFWLPLGIFYAMLKLFQKV